MHGAACDEGECATAQAAGALGALMAASTESTRTLEEIAQAATGPLWFQLYFSSATRGHAERLAQRAESAGYRALVLTVDSSRWGQKERHIRSEATYDWPPSGNFVDDPLPPADEANDNADDGAALTWADVAWLRSVTSLPLVLKGILTAEDARLAVEHGVAGILVSNHGGRQLDTVAPTIEALPEVVAAVAGRCEVYLDGGVRRGTDVLKALALGAHAPSLSVARSSGGWRSRARMARNMCWSYCATNWNWRWRSRAAQRSRASTRHSCEGYLGDPLSGESWSVIRYAFTARYADVLRNETYDNSHHSKRQRHSHSDGRSPAARSWWVAASRQRSLWQCWSPPLVSPGSIVNTPCRY